MRRSWIAAGIVVATVLALAAQTSVVTRTGFFAGDFRAFYCAAKVASQGADPYRTEPLGTCERKIGSPVFFEKNPRVTIPAPLPGYAIAALIPLARLPFGAAIAVWLALLFAGWLACVIAIAAFADVRREVTVAALALSLAALSFPFGEVVPIAVGFICLAGYAAWRDRPALAALFAAGSMIEPHLGLPVCVTLVVWLSGSRLVLALCAAAFAALSIVALGLPANVEYFTSVLPAHALSELTRDTQYSLSAVLAAFGVAPNAAIRGGSVWYLAMLVLGTIVAGRVARSTGNRAFLACIPPAFAVFGGTFIHSTQIAAAIPAAILLASYTEKAERTTIVAALLLLAVPWGWVVSPVVLVAPFVPVAYLVWYYSANNLRTALVCGIATIGVVGAFMWLYTLHSSHIGAMLPLPPMDPKLPESAWSAYSRHGSTGSIAAWIVRIPSWAALGALLVVCGRGARFVVRREAAVPIALALAFTVLPIGAQFYGDRASGWIGVDFRAYYCAALAQRTGQNPYFAASLQRCEASSPRPFYRAPTRVTVPAPYPPYALAALAPLTFLPFEIAVTVWLALMIFSIGFAVYALSVTSGQATAVTLGALGLSAGLASLSTGNMVPLGVAAVVAAGLLVRQARWLWATIAIAVGMMEPHLALPAALACFVAYRPMRVPLGIATAALALLGVVTGGLAQSVQYLTAVIPAHALAEVSRDNQYSLATIVAAAGVPDAPATLIGSLSYVLLLVVGIVVALKLARRYEEPAFVVLVPPALSLLGGSFVHTGEIAAAVPAALLLYARAAELRALLLAAVVLLAVPWMYATSIALFLAPFFPAAYLVYELWRHDRTVALGVAVASWATIVGLFWLAGHVHGQPALAARFHPPIDPRLAESSWRQLVLTNSTNNPVMWLLRLPTWCGLLLFAVPAVLLARRQRLLATADIAVQAL